MIATAIDASAKDVKRPVRADFAGISSGSRPRAARARGETCWKMTFELFSGRSASGALGLRNAGISGALGVGELDSSGARLPEGSAFRSAQLFGRLSAAGSGLRR